MFNLFKQGEISLSTYTTPIFKKWNFQKCSKSYTFQKKTIILLLSFTLGSQKSSRVFRNLRAFKSSDRRF